jgi:HEAT repeat protein
MGFLRHWFLRRRLSSPEAAERRRAVEEIRGLPEPRALALLAPALKDPDAEVSWAAVKAVAAFRSREALARLGAEIEDRLFRMASGTPERIHDDRLESLVLALDGFGGAAAELLLRVLVHREVQQAAATSDGFPAGAHRAAELLGKLRYAPSVPALMARLDDVHTAVRVHSAASLGELGSTEAAPALTAALQDRDDDVRAAAASALGRLGAASAAAALEPLLADRSARVQEAAAEALHALGWKPAHPESLARSAAARDDLMSAAQAGLKALRPLLARLWTEYGIENLRSNDVGGVSRQLKNLMERSEIRRLPPRERIETWTAAAGQALAEPGPDRPRVELQMIASLPDLRVRTEGRVERENEGSGATYLETVEFDATLSCDALRKRASGLLAGNG